MSGVHTPGPWIADDFCMVRDEARRVGTSDGTPSYYHRTTTICETEVNWRGSKSKKTELAADGERAIGIVEAEANARLIAAAPDMLAALQALVPRFETACRYAGNDEETARSATADARAAIARATGAA